MIRIHTALRKLPRCLAMVGLLSLAGCADVDRTGVFNDLAADLQAQGHLRTDIRPPDARVTVDDLARNFHRIAFSYEFAFRNGKRIDGPLPKPLKRWRGEVRYRLVGDGVTQADRAELAAFFARLAPLTGLAFRPTSEKNEQLLISIATRAGRKALSRQFSASGNDAYRQRYDAWRRTPGWTCGATLSVARDDPHRFAHAHVFLGNEARGIMRTSCLHEEIVQALGLTNDHPDARPSIFNDDQEFALLTVHDEVLLQALYDPRLKPGMSADEALPIARQVFAELLPRTRPTRLAQLGIGRGS